jgi:Reverse transcriptase (RNA-dependent DNA polymerase)
MGYYHIELSPDSKRLCTIVLPWGKYEYQKLPMGLCNSPDIFQEKMSELFGDLEFIRTYIDNLLVLTKSDWQDHLHHLDIVLTRLKRAGLKVNARKSFFGREELEYLGYWISRSGIQPIAKKVEAIKNIAPPTTKRELRRFIGIVNYYRDMWVRRADVLAPLTALTSKTAKWRWTELKHDIQSRNVNYYLLLRL